MFKFLIELIINFLLVILLIIVSYKDMKYKIIPNKYTIPAIVSGFVLMTIHGGFAGLQNSFYGFLLGFLIFLIPVLVGFMGAGDLKLMAAIGALKGFIFTFNSLVAAGIAGGILVIVYVIYKRQFLKTLINMVGIIIRPIAKLIYLNSSNNLAKKIFTYFNEIKKENSDLYIPYALPIALGTMFILISNFNILLI